MKVAVAASRRFVALVLMALGLFLVLSVTAQVGETATSDAAANQSESSPAEPTVPEDEPEFLKAEPEQWGTYYDPQQEFCGKFDCYRILGFDFESFGSPDQKVITKRYRRISRKWHPDKSKHPKAKERFVKIVRAYEVLTNNEKRKEYDFMRYNQEAYYQKYGSSVIWTFKPKSDVTSIVLVLFLFVNLFSWFAQKNKWQNVADRLVKAAAEEWSPSQGGSPESKELREHALTILAERESETNGTDTTIGEEKSAAAIKKAKGKGKKLTGKEKKKQETESILPILKKLVDEMHDFGGGFHKPTWQDLMIVNLALLPFRILVGIVWEAKYYLNRFQGKELSDEEKEVLTERAVGPVAWDLASDESREEMMKRELWIMNNLVEWKEEEEIKNLSSREQKELRKTLKAEKKKGSKQA